MKKTGLPTGCSNGSGSAFGLEELERDMREHKAIEDGIRNLKTMTDILERHGF